MLFTCAVAADVSHNDEQQSHTNDPGHDGSFQKSYFIWSVHINVFQLSHQAEQSVAVICQPWTWTLTYMSWQCLKCGQIGLNKSVGYFFGWSLICAWIHLGYVMKMEIAHKYTTQACQQALNHTHTHTYNIFVSILHLGKWNVSVQHSVFYHWTKSHKTYQTATHVV